MRRLRSYLYQGDVSDLNVLKDPVIREKYSLTLVVNVGSTPFVPRDLPTIYLPMRDESVNAANDWLRVIRVLRLVIDEVRSGGKVFVNCDAGISRSVVFSAMLISALEHRMMDDELMQEIRATLSEPLHALWVNGYNALMKNWEFL
jgi:protein-tyrosine phosphatase